MCTKSVWSCPTLSNLVDCSPPVSSDHGIPQARILEWVSMPSSRGSSWPRDWTHVLCLLHWQMGSLPLATPGSPQRRKKNAIPPCAQWENGGSYQQPNCWPPSRWGNQVAYARGIYSLYSWESHPAGDGCPLHALPHIILAESLAFSSQSLG